MWTQATSDELMDRVPEPELMDDPLQARAYAAADFSEPHDAFVAHFDRCFPDFRGTSVLDLGCGPADVTIRFARAHGGCRVVGVDGAEAMLSLGRQAVARADLSPRIELRRVRLPEPGFPAVRFDAVISNSLLHHLADSQVLWNTARSSAAPGAPVFVMDLMRPDSRAAARQLVAIHADGAPEVLRRDFHASLLAAFRPEEVRAQLVEAGLLGFAVEVVSDRHLIAYGRM